MRRDEAIGRLKAHEGELRKLGVDGLYMFGSTARDQAADDADVDLFFDHEVGALGLFEVMDVMEQACLILGRRVDVMTRRSIHPGLRERIESTAIRIF